MSARVLLVDDDEFARSFARAVLERAGFEVVEADNIASAMATANSLQPAAVVTDWHLPDGDGGTLVQTLRRQASLLPVILVTGDAGGVGVQDDTEPRFATILEKPYMPSALENALRQALLI